MRAREGRPLLLIDIAVPRDVDAGVRRPGGVTLYDIDDLQAVVARTLASARGERRAAEQIVEEEIQRFARWMGQLDVLPTVAALREHGDAIVDQVLAENAGRWECASPATSPGSTRSPARSCSACCTSRRSACARWTRPATAAWRCVRELFGIDEARRATARASDRAARDNVRQLRGVRRVRIATRGSALALAQARRWPSALGGAELVEITTSGDRDRDVGDKGALGGARSSARCSRGEADLAVHSAKDVPAELRRRARARRASPPRADAARRAVRRAGARRARARAPASARLAAPRGAAARAARRTSTSSSCAATSTRGCASSPTASRRDRARLRRARSAWAAPSERRAARDDRARAPARAALRARGPRATRPTRCGRRVADQRPVPSGLAAERASSRALGRRLPHAGGRPRARRPTAACALRAFVGARRRLGVGDRRARRRRRPRGARRGRGASGCSPRAPGRCWPVTGVVYLVGAGPGRPGPADGPRARSCSRAPTWCSPTSSSRRGAGRRRRGEVVDVGKIGGGEQVPAGGDEPRCCSSTRAPGAPSCGSRAATRSSSAAAARRRRCCAAARHPVRGRPRRHRGRRRPRLRGHPGDPARARRRGRVRHRPRGSGQGRDADRLAGARRASRGRSSSTWACARCRGSPSGSSPAGARADEPVGDRRARDAARPAQRVGHAGDDRRARGRGAGVRAPAVTVVGPVAALGDELAWLDAAARSPAARSR